VRLALVHGFTQTGRSWAPIAGRLREAGHDVVTPDVPGHGGREAAAMWDAADALAAEVGRAVWVGYSLGGRLGLHVALAHPEVIDGLVLVSTTAGIEDPAERERRRQADESLAATIGPLGVAAFVERWLDGPLWATLPRESAGVDARLANTAEGLAASLRLAGPRGQRVARRPLRRHRRAAGVGPGGGPRRRPRVRPRRAVGATGRLLRGAAGMADR
jgi:2-succinyl-6-hydroxy-2,4-cyclohexadiene-1-carboxylate synthase